MSGRKMRIMHECFVWLSYTAGNDIWCCGCPIWIGLGPGIHGMEVVFEK